MYANSEVAKSILNQTQATDDKFAGQWKDHYTKKFMYAVASDDTYVIIEATGYKVLAIGIGEFEADYDDNEKSNLCKVIATGEIVFTDGLYESYKATR